MKIHFKDKAAGGKQEGEMVLPFGDGVLYLKLKNVSHVMTDSEILKKENAKGNVLIYTKDIKDISWYAVQVDLDIFHHTYQIARKGHLVKYSDVKERYNAMAAEEKQKKADAAYRSAAQGACGAFIV